MSSQIEAALDEYRRTLHDPPADYKSGTTEWSSQGGVHWSKALIPPARHECTAWTDGWIGFDRIQRCACGAVKFNSLPWKDKNSRST